MIIVCVTHISCHAKWQTTSVSVSLGHCNNNQMLSGLKQIYYLIILGVRCSKWVLPINKAVFLLKPSKGGSIFLLFPASRVYLHSLVHFPISSSAKSAVISGVFLMLDSFSAWLSPLSILKNSGYIRTTQIIWGTLFTRRSSLNHSLFAI